MPIELWPDDYKSWQGSFDDLVRVAGDILKAQDPTARKPTASLVRHYQQIGAVGRGQPRGRSRLFSFEDLAAVVATKGLVKRGVGLDVATEVLANSSPAQKLAYSDYGPIGNPGSDDAVGTVASLLKQAGLDRTKPTTSPLAAQSMDGVLRSSGSIQSFAGQAMQTALSNGTPFNNTDARQNLNPTPTQALRPTPWLDIYYNPDAMAKAPRHERDQAAESLEHLLRVMRGSPNT